MSIAEQSEVCVLHVPENIAGNPYALSLAERRVGLRSRCVELAPHPFGYPCDHTLARTRIGAEIARPRLLAIALGRPDIVHFNFGRTIAPLPITSPAYDNGIWRALVPLYDRMARLMNFRDVDLLRKRGKVIAVTFQGSDVRQWSSGGYSAELHEGYGRSLEKFDEKKRRLSKDWTKRADLMFALNPDLLRFLPPWAQFLPYASVDPRDFEFVPTNRREGRLRVAHAPTNRAAKGSQHVLAAVDSLRREGLDIELDLIEGVRHTEAISRYRRADVVVDQLLIGWYGGLAVETMAMGKPTIAYVSPQDLQRAPSDFAADLPIVRADPNSITDALRQIFFWTSERMSAVSYSSRRFVENHHDPMKIAAGVKKQYLSAIAKKTSQGSGEDFQPA